MTTQPVPVRQVTSLAYFCGRCGGCSCLTFTALSRHRPPCPTWLLPIDNLDPWLLPMDNLELWLRPSVRDFLTKIIFGQSAPRGNLPLRTSGFPRQSPTSLCAGSFLPSFVAGGGSTGAGSFFPLWRVDGPLVLVLPSFVAGGGSTGAGPYFLCGGWRVDSCWVLLSFVAGGGSTGAGPYFLCGGWRVH